MEQKIKMEIFERLDHHVAEQQMKNAQVQVAQVIRPLLGSLSKEYGVDEIDLFVAYMDHVAVMSRHMAMKEEEMQVNIDSPDFKLY